MLNLLGERTELNISGAPSRACLKMDVRSLKLKHFKKMGKEKEESLFS
jgi:hypothetical protein